MEKEVQFVEFIEKYIKHTGDKYHGDSYEYYDNVGTIVRCKKCRYHDDNGVIDIEDRASGKLTYCKPLQRIVSTGHFCSWSTEAELLDIKLF